MNRTGLTIALGIGFAVGVICAVDPQLDLDIAGAFFDPARHLFDVNAQMWVQHTREAARVIITLLVLPAFLAVIGKLIWPQRRMLIEAPRRAVPDRDAGARARPSHQRHSQGSLGPAAPDRRAAIRRRLSLHAVVGPARRLSEQLLVHRRRAVRRVLDAGAGGAGAPELQPLAYAAALAFGAGVGVLRIAAGAHFFSDVVFAGVFMYLLIWLIHGLIYRWPATRIDEAAAERRLTEAGEKLGALARRLSGRNGKAS